MHNARIRWLTVLWLFLPWLVLAQPPPALVRSVLTTNLPAFGSAGQVLTRQAGIPYLLWLPPSGDLVLSNYVTAISNLLWQSDNIVSNWVNSVSNQVNGGEFIKSASGLGTNTTVYTLLQVQAGDLSVIDNNTEMLLVPQIGYGQLYAMNVAPSHYNALYLGNSEVNINGDGTVGIFTNSPQSRLHIVGTGFKKDILRLGTTAIDSLLSVSTNGEVKMTVPIGVNTNVVEFIGTNGITGKSVVITSDAKVGIGTNLPQAILHIRGTNGPSQYVVQVENPMAGTASARTNGLLMGTNGNVAIGCGLSTASLTMSGVVRIAAGSSADTLFGGDSSYPYANSGSLWFYNGGGALSGWGTYGPTYATTTLTNRVLFRTQGSERARFEPWGYFGLGTNAPASWFHVTADNSAANVAQFGTTNKPSQVTLSTNGVLSVNPGGGLNPVGCWGALMNNTSNTVVCPGAAGVYTNICGTGFTTMYTNGFYGNVSAIVAGLTNLYAGYYRVDISCSYLGANSSTYEFDVTTNGVICALVEVKNTTDNPARFRSASCGGLIYLPANTGVQMMVQDQGNGTTVNVFRSALRIGTP